MIVNRPDDHSSLTSLLHLHVRADDHCRPGRYSAHPRPAQLSRGLPKFYLKLLWPGLAVISGVKIEVRGRENLPQAAR